ncbi:DUF4234 domain-containing protein [Anaerocellum danielii]|uniref:DUF4234 domain-containing protein n=1 Tax=Anaerocellum danielii TaxID=1387557 RepID=A0ABZ0U1K2_9FIRM|nr:DUF4234 domain-containing protein [Caldicellulosiruptor danielii]WPX08972.1 DUF4234 domain-containing protein [Caldicellulosiruptor danielii]
MPGKKRSVVGLLVFSIITLGIYYFYWIYATSKETQAYLEKQTLSPGLELFLCIITCGLYWFYWIFKYSKITVECQQKAGLPPEDNAVINLILSILGLGIISSMILQASLNKVCELESSKSNSVTPTINSFENKE